MRGVVRERRQELVFGRRQELVLFGADPSNGRRERSNHRAATSETTKLRRSVASCPTLDKFGLWYMQLDNRSGGELRGGENCDDVPSSERFYFGALHNAAVVVVLAACS